MNEKMKRILQGLKKAMQAEVEGSHFYLMAARSTDDEQGRRTFEQLAQDEVNHLRFLKAQYKSIIEKGKTDPEITLSDMNSTNTRSPHPIFSEKLKNRIQDAHFEMTSLAVGIQLELNAIKFYQQEAEQAEDAVTKKFFSQLAQWEKGHYEALLNQQQLLQEDYWNDAGFEPF
jgi:rubrerythrin